MVVVLLIVGGMLINSLTAERTVRDATQASNAGQLVAASVGQGVRNAQAIWKTEPVNIGDPELLFVSTIDTQSTADPYCQAWSFQDGQIRTTTSGSAIATDSESVANWTLLSDGVAQVPGLSVFAETASRVTLNLDVESAEGQSVRITTSFTSRLLVAVPEDSAPCS